MARKTKQTTGTVTYTLNPEKDLKHRLVKATIELVLVPDELDSDEDQNASHLKELAKEISEGIEGSISDYEVESGTIKVKLS